MTRWVLLVLLAVLIWQGLERIVAALRSGSLLGPTAPQPGTPRPERSVETLVRCAACGTYVLRARAVPGMGSQSYCSEPCRDGAPRAS